MPHTPPTPELSLEERRRRAQLNAQHRRRRTVAGLVVLLVLVVLVVAISAIAGGSSPKPVAVRRSTPVATTPIGKLMLAKESDAVSKTLERMPLVGLAGSNKRDIALTFDDGPGPYTIGVAKVLKRYGVPATFFQVGVTEHYWTDAENMLASDHQFVLGNHTMNHLHMPTLSRKDQAAQLDQDSAIIFGAGAPTPQLFRPPYGAFDRTTLKLLKQRRMLMILWTVDSQDYTLPGVPVIVQRVVDGAKPGAIVLMHDAGGDRTQTIAALPLIIHALREKHYKLVTIPRLMLDDPPPAKQPPITVGAG